MSQLTKVQIVGGLLKRIGNFNATSFQRNFNERLIYQKTIYLMQAYGLYIGVPFSWYLHGPYSPLLAKHGFELINNYDQIQPIRFASASSENRFASFCQFLGSRRNDAKWLEALASIHFLRNTYPNRPKSEIISQLREKQPALTLNECFDAWDYLVRYNLIRGGN